MIKTASALDKIGTAPGAARQCAIIRTLVRCLGMAVKRTSHPDPDGILAAQLSGRAIYLARAGGSIAEAVEDLCAMASGRGDPARQARSRRAYRPTDPKPKPRFRSDLLAKQAGLMGGWWAANPGGQQGEHVVAVGLLVMAGADLDLFPASFALGHQRGSR